MTGKSIKEVARERAAAVLDTHWDITLPVDPYAIATSAGLKVLTARLEGNVSGMLRKQPYLDAEIWLDVRDSSKRRAFTCAHELGHYFDRQPSENEAIGYVDHRNPGKVTPSETFANEFAANLLMPAEAVHAFVDEGMHPIAMAGRFDVSLSAMRIRLANLGITT